MSYLQELTETAAEAYNHDGERPAFPPYIEDAAEAVASKVLRDFIASQTSEGYVFMAGDEARDWAQSVGINLEGDEG